MMNDLSNLSKAINSFPDKNHILIKMYKLDLLLKIAFVLRKFHHIGLEHFDLKELNVLMMNLAIPVVIDLEYTQLKDKVDKRYIFGSPLYLGGKNIKLHYDDRDDLFAFGIMIPQIISGINKSSDYYNHSDLVTLLDKKFINKEIFQILEKSFLIRGIKKKKR